MRTPWGGVRRLARRVESLETENAELRRRLDAGGAEPEAPRRFDRRGLLRLGGVAAAAGAGTVLLRPDAAGATTAAMSFGAENNAGATGTGLTSSNGTDTLHVTNSGTGAVINASITALTNAHSAIHAINGSTDPNSSAVYGEMTNPDATGNGVVGLAFAGAGVMGSSGGSGPGVIGIAGDAQAVVAWASDNNAAPALEAEHDGDGDGVYSHIANTAGAGRAVYGLTTGTGEAFLASITNGTSKAAATKSVTKGSGAGVDAASSKGVGGKFAGKTAQVQLVPSAAATHPANGAPGQLFVDKSKRLWYCKGGTSWHQIV